MEVRTVSEEKPEIYAAIARVVSKIGVVGKNKKNAQQGYQFRALDDVVAHCNEVMAAEGVIVVPRVVAMEREAVATKSGGSMYSVRLTVDHWLFASDGSSVTCTTVGEAADAGDKSAAKAMSSAFKYCLTQVFMIPTYEVDRDIEEHSPELAPKPAPKPAGKPVPVSMAAAKSAIAAARAPRPSPSALAPEPPPHTDDDAEIPF
jgi:hypothetical protein